MIQGLKVGFREEAIRKIMNNMESVLRSGHLIHGEFYVQFQDLLKDCFCKNRAVLTNSSTSAHEILFHLLAREADLKKKERPGLVCQGNAYPSVVIAARRQGLNVVLVDIDPETLSFPVDSKAVGELNPIVHITHIGGVTNKNISEIAHKCRVDNGATIVEDVAHSIGSRYAGRGKAGCLGDFAICSFFATKPLNCAEGGAIVTNSDLAENAERMTRYGKVDLFGDPCLMLEGFSARFSEINAAIGVVAFEEAFGFVKTRRRQIAEKYISSLSDKIKIVDHGESSFYKFIVWDDRIYREDFKKYMAEKGITLSSCVFDRTIQDQPIFANDRILQSYDIPMCKKFCSEHFCLPMHEFLTDEEVDTVIEEVLNYV